MDKTDLSLVSIEELLDEISNRSECYIAAYKLKADEKEVIYTHWQDKKWFKNLELSSALQCDLLACCMDKKDLYDKDS